MIYLFSHLTQDQPVRRSMSTVRMKVELWRERRQSGRNVLGATGQRQEGKQNTLRFPEPRESGLLGQRDDSVDKMCSVFMICSQFLIENIIFF